MRRIAAIVIAICLFAATSFAQTRVPTLGLGFSGFAAQNPITSGGGGGDFFYPFQINFPACTATVAISNPPWDPNGVVQDYYLQISMGNPGNCNGGASPNPEQGVYIRENQPHRAHDVVFWFMISANVLSPTFILRLNDSTAGATTGVYRGAVDYTAPQINASNQLISDLPGDSGASAALTPGTWYQVEYCYVSGTSGSGTVPPKEKFWLNGTQFITFGNGTTPHNVGGGDTLTLDCEFGSAPGTCNFGPVLDFDTGADCPASALATMYYTAVFPSSNGTVQFTPNANTNWQNAAASIPGNLSYNSDATVGQEDIYNLTLGTYGTILAITERASMEKTAAGARAGLLGYHIGSTDYPLAVSNGFSLGGDTNGTHVASGLQSGEYQSVMTTTATDPSTSTTWSGATNASHILVKVNN